MASFNYGGKNIILSKPLLEFIMQERPLCRKNEIVCISEVYKSSLQVIQVEFTSDSINIHTSHILRIAGNKYSS